MTDARTPVERLHAMFAEACFGEANAAFGDDASELARYLERHRIDPDDATALLASPRRLGLYRRLVRYNVIDVVGVMLERTRARLAAHAEGAFEDAIDDFLAKRGPRTSHLRDVPGEFLAWARPLFAADARLPPWLGDYADLELAAFTVGTAKRPAPPPPLAEVAVDRPLVFTTPRVLVRLEWAVHELPVDDPRAEPSRRPIDLLVYRDATHTPRYLALSPLARAILERLFAAMPLARAMSEACAAEGHPLDDAVLAGAAKLLADLGERGILLGARA